MKTWILLACLFCTACSTLSAEKNWTKGEKTAEVVWQSFHLVDIGTTLDIENHPDLHEVNPILSEHHSREQILLWGASSAVLHLLITDLLPRKSETLGFTWNPRATWQYLSIGITGLAVTNNLSLGLTINY